MLVREDVGTSIQVGTHLGCFYVSNKSEITENSCPRLIIPTRYRASRHLADRLSLRNRAPLDPVG